MKKIYLFCCMFTLLAMNAFSQCTAPTSFSVNEHWNYVDLSWTSDAFDIDTSLYYGNVQSTSIGTGTSAASYMCAIRFSTSDLTAVDGMYLTGFSFYPSVSANFTIKVWTGGSIVNDTTYNEGTLVDSVVLTTNDITTGQINTVQFSNPLLINASSELWIGVSLDNTSGYPVGASSYSGTDYINEGDLLYLNGGWQSMIRDQSLPYVWNMQVSFMVTPSSITGFNVLRDNVALNSTPFMGFSYRDTTVTEQTSYCYTVESVCGSTSTIYNPAVCITTPAEPTCNIAGTGTNGSYIIPLNTYYNYSYSQQLFTPTDLGNLPGVIESIGFQYFYSTPQTKENITIYMANVSDSTFASTSSWIPYSNLTQVFQGTITFSNANTWTTVDFDNVFEWDGVSNVVVAVLNGSGIYTTSNSQTFYTHNVTYGNSTLYLQTDNSAYNPASISGGTISTMRNNIQFCLGPAPTCYRPQNVSVYNVQSSSANITWARHSTENEWQLVVVEEGAHVSTGTPTSIYDTVYTITNLLSNTTYDVYVKAVCSVGDESNWVKRTFTTTCTPTNILPIIENFDNISVGSIPDCYIISGSNTNYPIVSASQHSSGSNSFFFSNSYTNNSYVAIQAIDPTIAMSELMVSFSLYKTGGAYRLDVGIMTDPMDISTFQLIQTVNPSNTGSWQNFQIFFDNYQGNGTYIAFRSDLTSLASSNSIYMDDLVVDYAPQCSAPIDLTISNISGSSAMVSWNFNGMGTPASYTAEISETGMDNWTPYPSTNLYYLFSGLNPSTSYDVRISTTCDDNSTSIYSSTVTFVTRCLSGGNREIGTGNESSSQLPTNGCYNYSYSQQLYSSVEIGNSSTLSGISLNLITAAANNNRNLTIYLANTDLTTLSTSNYVLLDSLTQVFTGNVNFALGWNDITFTTPFQHDGRNLVIAVDDNTGSYSCSPAFACSSGATSIYSFSDGTNYNPANPTFSYSTFLRNNIVFSADCDSSATCILPNVIITRISSTEVDLEWVPGYTETAWELDYKMVTDTIWTSLGTPLTGNTYTLNNLNVNSSYKIRMRSDCGSGSYSDWAYLYITTPCSEISTLPFTENFDSTSTVPDCWYSATNYTYTTYPIIDANYSQSSPNSLRFYGSSTNYTYAALPAFDPTLYPTNNLMVSFYLYTTSNTYFIEVGIMSDPEDYSSFQTISSLTPSAINTWENFEVYFNSYTGTTGNIAFRTPIGIDTYANIDNIIVDEIPSCFRPENLVISNIQQTEVTLSWTPNDNNSFFEIIIDTVGADMNNSLNTFTSTDTFITIQNLTANTYYNIVVRTLCPDGISRSTDLPGNFFTLCNAITSADLPYMENFDTYSTGTSAFPNCWRRPVIYNNAPYISSSYSHSSPGALLFTSLSTDRTTAVTPQLDVDIQTLQVSFQLKAESINYSGTIEVGVMSDASDITTFESVQIIQPTDNTFHEYEIPLNNTQLTGTGNFIAFRQITSSSYYYYWMDDVLIETIPTCPRPSSIFFSGTTINSLTLSWVATGTETDWNIIYGPSGFNPSTEGITISTNTMPITITNLSNDTIYDFYVQADCGSGEVSLLRGPISAYPGVINMPISGVDTINMCGGHIFDDGGVNGNYSNYCNGTLIIYPDAPGNIISLQGTYAGEGCCDYLYIYDGAGTSGTLLATISSSNSGTVMQVGPFISTTGPLTVSFTSDGSVNYPGFDLSINCLSASCLPPSNLSGISDLNSIILSWTENGTATNWNIIYGPTGFDPVTGGTTINATTNPYTVSGLAGTTSYDFYVQSDCGSGETSILSSVGSFNTSICSIADQCSYTITRNDSYGDGWNGATLIIKQNGITIATLGGDNSFSVITDSVALCNGLTTTLEWVAGVYDQECSFTITDANNNIITSFAENSLGISGVIDTFMVNCGGVPTTCTTPTALAAVPSDVTANVTWTAGGTETAWILEYKLASATTWTPVNVATTPAHTLTGLTVSTDYNVRVKAVCGATDESEYTATVNFTTLAEPCDVPTNVQVVPSSNGATVTWTSTESAWIVGYRLAGSANWTESQTLTSPTYQITGLQQSTDYEVRVKSVCSPGESVFTTNVAFTTTAGGTTTYTVTASATGPGTISPSGVSSVQEGSNITFTITPNANCSASLLLVDDVETAIPADNQYTFTNITANHTIAVTFTTGINEIVLDKAVTLYPNPASTMIELMVSNDLLIGREAVIYDVYGKQIAIIPIEGEKTQIDISNFASGVYVVRITADQGMVMKKFIKK